MIPYVGSEIVEVLIARQSFSKPASPALPKRWATDQRSEPVPFPHILSNLRHSNALVAIIGLITRCLS
jgi:hypothetical protein